MWIPIRNCQKEPTIAKIEGRQIDLQLLREAIIKAQHNWDKVYTTNFILFTSFLIDFIILQEEREFYIR